MMLCSCSCSPFHFRLSSHSRNSVPHCVSACTRVSAYVCRRANDSYIEHTISEDEIRMHIFPGSKSQMPRNPTHATITIESRNETTKKREFKRFRCDFNGCSRTYSTAGNLKTHRKTHTGDLTFVCNQEGCGKGECRCTTRFMTDDMSSYSESRPSPKMRE